MKKVLLRTLNRFSCLGIALSAMSTMACVDHGSPLVIIQAQVDEASDKGCTVPAKRTDRLIEGVFDVALDRDHPFLLFPLVHNALPSLLPMGMAKEIEPNKIEVTGARIRIEGPPGINIAWPDSCPQDFEVPGQLWLSPGEEGAIRVDGMRECHSRFFRSLFQKGQLNPSLAERIRFRVVARAKGKHGSTGIVSDPFEFPVRVCFGCLQSGFNDPGYSAFNVSMVPNCALLSENRYTGNPCHPAQGPQLILCCAKDGAPDQIQCPGIPTGKVPGAKPGQTTGNAP